MQKIYRLVEAIMKAHKANRQQLYLQYRRAARDAGFSAEEVSMGKDYMSKRLNGDPSKLEGFVEPTIQEMYPLYNTHRQLLDTHLADHFDKVSRNRYYAFPGTLVSQMKGVTSPEYVRFATKGQNLEDFNGKVIEVPDGVNQSDFILKQLFKLTRTDIPELSRKNLDAANRASLSRGLASAMDDLDPTLARQSARSLLNGKGNRIDDDLRVQALMAYNVAGHDSGPVTGGATPGMIGRFIIGSLPAFGALTYNNEDDEFAEDPIVKHIKENKK